MRPNRMAVIVVILALEGNCRGSLILGQDFAVEMESREVDRCYVVWVSRWISWRPRDVLLAMFHRSRKKKCVSHRHQQTGDIWPSSLSHSSENGAAGRESCIL